MPGAWTPNEELYGPGGGDYTDDLGISTPDPWGVLAPSAAPPGVADFVSQIRPPAPIGPQPIAHPNPAAPDRAADLSAQLSLPVPTPGSADRQGAVTPPVPRPGSADLAPAMIPVTTTTTDTSLQTSGLDAGSAAKVEAAGQAANTAAGAAGAAQVDTLNA